MTITAIDETRLHATATDVLSHLNGFMTSLAVHYGQKVGIYRALQQIGPSSSADLAAHMHLDERWLREWLHQQAAAGVIEHESGERFSMSPEAALVLADDSTPASMVGFFTGLDSLWRSFEYLPTALQTGRGRSYDEMGEGVASFVEMGTLPWNEIVIEQVIPALEDVAAKLDAGATVIDFGCGAGARTIGLAEAFPRAKWRGYDTSSIALQRAAGNLAASGATNVSFHDAMSDPLPADHSVDLVTMFDVAHDLPHPQQALEAIYAALKPDGTAVVSDIAQPEALVEKLALPAAPTLYGFSLSACLQCGTSDDGGLALGALGLSEDVLRRLAGRAGFTRVRRTEAQDALNVYYELRP